jgi:Rieske Fe-S protein
MDAAEGVLRADLTMQMNRKQFLMRVAVLTAACPCAGLCGTLAVASGERVVNAGPVGAFAADGLYEAFRDQGFFIVRQGARLFALSAICTHRHCKLAGVADQSFYCKCHGSTFDPNGRVKEGPARRDLPVLHLTTNESGQLLVTVPAG